MQKDHKNTPFRLQIFISEKKVLIIEISTPTGVENSITKKYLQCSNTIKQLKDKSKKKMDSKTQVGKIAVSTFSHNQIDKSEFYYSEIVGIKRKKG